MHDSGLDSPDISRRRLLLTAAGLAAAATGVTGLSACNASAGQVPGAAPSSGAGGGAEPGAYPVTIAHKFGETEITAAPERVVTAGLKEQDDCLALGVVPVAATTWFDLDGSKLIGAWAKEALGGKPEPTVLTYVDKLEFEKIAAAAPDVIIALYSGLTKADYDRLAKIAPTVAQPKEYSDYGIPWDLEAVTVGKILGRPQRMTELVDAAKAAVSDAGKANPEFAGKSAVVATPYEGIFVYGDQDPRSRLLTELGMTLPPDLAKAIGNEFGGSISNERVDVLDTDLIIWFVEGENRKEIDENLLYTALDVHKQGRELFMSPGDKVYEPYSFLTVLSLAYLLQSLVPKMKLAVDGDAETKVS